MAEQTIKTMNLQPDYMEKFLKNLLKNIFDVDETTGEIAGFATESPLFGKPVYATEDGGTTYEKTEAVLGADGNPVQYYEGPDGNFTTVAEEAATDQYGNPIFAVEGGVAPPDVMGFTDPQVESLEMAQALPGQYKPYLAEAGETYREGLDLTRGSTEAYDPLSYQQFYDPFVEEVIDAEQREIGRLGQINSNTIDAQGVASGAFGGSRSGVAQQENQRNVLNQQAQSGAQLRSAAYTGAQQQAQSAFENQMKRGQGAGQLFQGLGTGIGALGEATQALGAKDVNALFNVGSLEQGQLQAEYDVQRSGQLEQAYEPFGRFSFMRDILSGVPTSGTGLTSVGTPQASPFTNATNNANIYSAGGGDSIFGNILNPSGA